MEVVVAEVEMELLQRVVQAVFMEDREAFRAVLLEQAQFALFGVMVDRSLQQIRVTCNGTFYSH
jgi:hypothetical protein